MVFIHPTIIDDPAKGHLISQSKYTFLRDRQEELADAENMEIEPELDEFPDAPAPSGEGENDADLESSPDAATDEASR